MATTTHTTSPAILYIERARLKALLGLPHTPDSYEQTHLRLHSLDEAMIGTKSATLRDIAAKTMLIHQFAQEEQTTFSPLVGSLLEDLQRLIHGEETPQNRLA